MSVCVAVAEVRTGEITVPEVNNEAPLSKGRRRAKVKIRI